MGREGAAGANGGFMKTKIELANCENTLLREISDKTLKRRDIAQTYRLAMQSSEKVNWGKVNQAIIDRWSYFGLEWIRRQAHTGKCFERKTLASTL